MCRRVLSVLRGHNRSAGEEHVERVGREGVVAGEAHDALGFGGVRLLGRTQGCWGVHHVRRVRVSGSGLHRSEGVVRM